MMLNKINYRQHPYDIPDTDSGNLRLYWEMEALRASYESGKMEKDLERYIQIIDVLGERGQFVELLCDCEIDKATRRTDWYEMITKPVPSPGKKESREKFISRCISTMSHKDPDRKHDQIVAMCHEAYRRRKK